MDGKIIDDPNEIANGFNNYFASIGTKLASKFVINNDYLKYILTVNSRFNFRLILSIDKLSFAEHIHSKKLSIHKLSFAEYSSRLYPMIPSITHTSHNNNKYRHNLCLLRSIFLQHILKCKLDLLSFLH